MWRFRAAVAMWMLAYASCPSTALADAAAQARFHDELAREHYARGRFEEAVREFFLEQRLAPNPRVAFNIALCFQQLGRHEDAYTYFDEYLSSDDSDEQRRETARAGMGVVGAKVARLRVTSEPGGAKIYVDDIAHGEYGLTPRTLALPAGQHRVWVVKDGYRPVDATTLGVAGKVVDVRLEPVPILGDIVVRSSVAAHAEVRAPDGRLVAQGPTPLEARLSPAVYEVSVGAAGFLQWHGLATVRADESVERVASMRALPPPTGGITVTANVPGALVELDGRPVGFTPTVLGTVRTGARRLSVTADGVVPWQGQVDVSRDSRSWVTVTLAEPAETRRSPLTWVAGGVGAAALLGAGITGFLALRAHSDFESATDPGDRRAAYERGDTLNTTTDVLLVSGLVTAGLGVMLYLLTEEEVEHASSASVARGAQ